MKPYTTKTEREKRAYDIASRILREEVPKRCTCNYHNPDHTLDPLYGVIAMVNFYAQEEGVSEIERELGSVASVFHDTGFLEQDKNNEPIGARIAGEVLPEIGYTPQEISIIQNGILATAIPSNPKSLLEMIICDADVDNLGRDDFFEKNELVRKELKIDDLKAWYDNSIKFLESHEYYTISARRLRDGKKQENIELLKKLKLQLETNRDAWREHGAYLQSLLTSTRIEDNVRYTEAQGEGLF